MPKHTARNVRKIAVTLLMIFCLLSPSLCTAFATSLETVQVLSAPLTTRSNATNGMVRVYLSSLGNPGTLNLTVAGSYSINGNTSQALSSGSALTVGFSSSTGAITLTHNGVKTNMGTYFALRRHSATGTNGIKISQAKESGNPYPGDLSFQAVKQSGGGYKLYTVAHIYIENYLYGVLPYEMGNSTNIEALKAQAVAARTYTVRMMQNRSSGYYDVVDTTNDQVYRGTPSGNSNCVTAVDATKGIVLMYGSNYITTYYSASNGGQTESLSNAWGQSNNGYLIVKDDPFDYANPSSTVKKTTVSANLTSGSNNAALLSLLKTKAVNALKQSGYAATTANTTLQTLKSVTPHTPKFGAPSRLYTKMDFTILASTLSSGGSSTTATVTVTCDIFSELEGMLSMSIQSSKNELWNVGKNGTSFVLQARRYGHGLGMSQRGAMYMAKLGYRYDEILGFYYTDCKRVQHSFTNTILNAGSGDTITNVEDPAEIPQEDGTACKGTVKLVNASATLAIRTSRATDASIVGTAGNGAMVNVLTNDGTWCFIQYGSLKGYVPTNALRITGTPNGQEDAPSVISGFATVTANDYVNLRSAGSMDASVLSTAPKGAILTVFSVSGAWAHVQYCATTAYVHTNFLSISSSYPSGVVSSGSATATVSAEEGINEVSLRASASTNAAVILSIPVGAEVSVSSDDGSWSVVVYQGTNGYLLSANLSYSGESLDPNQPNEGGGTDGGGTEPPAPGTETKAIVTTESGSLNMRAEPKAGSLVVTTIPRGTEVLVTSIGEAWCGVRYNGYTGYVMASFLTYSGDTITPPTTPPDLPQGENIAHVTTQSGSLNLRAEPRAGSQILRTIPRNATVTVLARGAEWCGVSYENNVGYVMSAFLTFDATNGEGESPGEGDSSTEPGQPTDPPAGNDPDEPITPDTGGENTLYATVTTVSGALNLRISPMPGSDVLARIPKGTTVVIDEKLAAWSKTSYAGQTGYVMNTFLTFRQGKPEESVGGDTAVVTTVSGSLNLRAEPSANAGLLMRIPQHATVSVQQRGDSWCYIGYGGTYGYAMTRFLTFSSMSADFAVPLPDDAAKNADDGTEEPGGTADTPAEPTSAPSEPPAVETAYVHTESGLLNLRAEPQENGQLLTTIPQNAAVTLLAYGESWCEVRYDAHTGYAMTRFLRFEAPAITEPPTQESDETEQAETDPAAAWVLTSAGSLNLRQSPDGNAQVLANIPRLAQVLLFSESNGWSYLQYQGTSGYVMSKFLTRENPNSTQTPSGSNGEQGDEKPPMPAKPDNGTQGDVSEESGITLDVTLRAPDQATFALAKPADVQTEQPIWPECAERGEALARVPRGEKVEIILIGDFWCLIQYQDVQAYCLRDALSVISE